MKIALFALALSFMGLPTHAANRVELVKNLSRSGENPAGKLIIASDGKFYGTTKNGGVHAFGSIYRFDPAQGSISTIASFGSNAGKYPNGELLDGGDGYLYGTAKQGSSIDFGTIFRVKLSDGTLTKLAQFDGVNSGKFPLGGLVKVSGRYYGVASEGGVNNEGTVFKLTPVAGSNNWDLGVFSPFGGTLDDPDTTVVETVPNGKRPWGTLVDSGGGVLLGTTEFGGFNNRGAVFKVPTSGPKLRQIDLIKHFAGGAADGENPRAGFWKSNADGYFYGTTYSGGASNFGTVFRITSLGTNFQIVASMEELKGSRPQAGVVEPPVADGFLYTTCSAGGAKGFGTVFKVNRDSNGAPINPDNVASFNNSEGQTPLGGLVFGKDGLIYGAAEQGGAGGLGAIYRVTPGISLRGAASFFATDGSNPRAALTAGPDGTLYGTTYDGGASGDGTVFKLAPDGTFSNVASFTGGDGANPLSQLVVMADGTIFGTTYKGGSNGRGTFFRLTPDGTIQPLIKFAATAAPLGLNPRGALVRRGNDFFGVTEKGGINNKGTLFKITVNPIGATPPATLTTLLEFSGVNGEFPFGGLTDGLTNGLDDFFYGTTTKGGANGFGTFFRLSAAGTHTKLYDFTDQNPTPAGTLVKDSAGMTFYGTSDPTVYSPVAGPGDGTVFKVTSAGALTTVYKFNGGTDGRGPRGVAQISNSLLAGITYGADGSLFTLSTAGGVVTPGLVYSFNDDFTGELQSARPEAPPFLAPDGAIYGVAQTSSFGGGAIFRMLFGPTSGITSITETADDSAIARGVVHPNGESATVFFEYSTSADFTANLVATTSQTITGTAAQIVSADLASLSPGATYFVRLKAGAHTSPTFIFGPPVATTGASSGVGKSVATLRGTANPNGRETSVVLEYGPTTDYGTAVTLASAGSGNSPAILESDLVGLTPQRTYHYRFSATNAAGTSIGADATFTTGQNSAPTAPNLFGSTTSLTADIVIPLPSGLDPDNEVLTLAVENQPSFGIVTLANSTTLRFTPTTGFKGTDTFTYSVTDPSLAKAIGTVTIRNPFVALKGSYLTYLTNAQGEPTGAVKLAVSATGSFTGTVSFGGNFPVKGVFDPSSGNRTGTQTITVQRPGKSPLLIVLRIDTTSEKGVLSGSVGDGISTQNIVTDSRLTAVTAAPQAGKYTVWLRSPSNPALPQGQGWATLSVSTKGACKMAGKLGDGTPFATTPTLRTTDSILLNVPLFTTLPTASRGYFFGEITFRDKPGSDADGSAKWKRGPQSASLYYPLGFGPEAISIVASRWAPLSALPGTHQLDLTEGGLEDNEPNNLPAQFNFTLAKTTTGVAKAIIASINVPEKTAFTANFKTGAFSGTFVHPDIGAAKARGFSGVLYQKQNTGVGVFLGTSTSGPVQIDLQ